MFLLSAACLLQHPQQGQACEAGQAAAPRQPYRQELAAGLACGHVCAAGGAASTVLPARCDMSARALSTADLRPACIAVCRAGTGRTCSGIRLLHSGQAHHSVLQDQLLHHPLCGRGHVPHCKAYNPMGTCSIVVAASPQQLLHTCLLASS